MYNIDGIKKVKRFLLFLSGIFLVLTAYFFLKYYQPNSLYDHKKEKLKSKTIELVNYNHSIRSSNSKLNDLYLDLSFYDNKTIYRVFVSNNIYNNSDLIVNILKPNLEYEFYLDKISLPRFDGKNAGIVQIESKGKIVYTFDRYLQLFRAQVCSMFLVFILSLYVWMYLLLKSLQK